MPRVPSVSPATGAQVPPHYIHTTAGQFVDHAGRTLILRGVNLGSAKAPIGQQSQQLAEFWDVAEAGGSSFVGQPLNLNDGSADEHLARLRGWGFNMIRFPVTWEALEHEGPGKYDFEYMDYVVRLLRKCKEFGFKVYIDPHQDVWSRFTGGSGAPIWTVYACGMNPRNLSAGRSHMLHCEWPSTDAPDPASYPAMMWSTNYGRLASQTLYTLFFAGRKFAPKCIIDGVNIQDYLQSHIVEAFGQLAERIRAAGDLLDECVIGWDVLNEPSEGFIGYPDLRESRTEQSALLKKGPFPYPAQSFRLGMGEPQTLDNWEFGGFGPAKKGTVTVDPRGVRAWTSPDSEPGNVHPRWGWRRDPGWELGTCIWALHGVWDTTTGDVLLPHYFSPDGLGPFTAEFWRPHWQKWIERIRIVHPECIHFIQPPVFVQPPALDEADTRGRLCYAPHYYDGLTLVSRHWHWYNADALGMMRGKYSGAWQAVKIGESAIRKSFQEQLSVFKEDCAVILGEYPTLMGEIGIPFDLDDRWSYGFTDNGRGLGNYKNQQKALDASLNACDGTNALNFTLWTYCPDNSHEWGDGWNLEDLSLWSPDDLRSARKPSLDAYEMHRRAPGVVPETSADGNLPSTSILDLAKVLPNGTGKIAGWDNAWDFLTDGARAVSAFVRPWPVAIVGIPVRWDFDIGRASFEFTVRVSSEDAAPDEECNPPTEIYVPLVHFASNKSLMGLWVDSHDDDEGKQSAQSSATASQVDLTVTAPSPSNMSLHKIPFETPSNDASEVTLFSAEGGVNISDLALDVRVSDGRWEISGQTLRWWYQVPERGQPPVEYKIQIKRSGGPIKLNELGQPMRHAPQQSRGWAGFCYDMLDCFS